MHSLLLCASVRGLNIAQRKGAKEENKFDLITQNPKPKTQNLKPQTSNYSIVRPLWKEGPNMHMRKTKSIYPGPPLPTRLCSSCELPRRRWLCCICLPKRREKVAVTCRVS